MPVWKYHVHRTESWDAQTRHAKMYVLRIEGNAGPKNVLLVKRLLPLDVSLLIAPLAVVVALALSTSRVTVLLLLLASALSSFASRRHAAQVSGQADARARHC